MMNIYKFINYKNEERMCYYDTNLIYNNYYTFLTLFFNFYCYLLMINIYKKINKSPTGIAL